MVFEAQVSFSSLDSVGSIYPLILPGRGGLVTESLRRNGKFVDKCSEPVLPNFSQSDPPTSHGKTTTTVPRASPSRVFCPHLSLRQRRNSDDPAPSCLFVCFLLAPLPSISGTSPCSTGSQHLSTNFPFLRRDSVTKPASPWENKRSRERRVRVRESYLWVIVSHLVSHTSCQTQLSCTW